MDLIEMDLIDRVWDNIFSPITVSISVLMLVLICIGLTLTTNNKQVAEKKPYIPQHVSIFVEDKDVRQLVIDDDSIKWRGRFKVEGKLWKSISWPEEEYKTCSDLTVIEDDDILILEGNLLWIGDVHIEINKKDIKCI